MDNWLDQAVWNSYQVLTGMFTFDELVDYLEMRREEAELPPDDLSTMPVFFIPPEPNTCLLYTSPSPRD